MYAQVKKSKENKSRAVANSVAQKKKNTINNLWFEDKRKESAVIKDMAQGTNYSERMQCVNDPSRNVVQNKNGRNHGVMTVEDNDSSIQCSRVIQLCSICLENGGENVTLDCSDQHTFHAACIIEWLRAGNTTCPLCRNEISPEKQAEITELVDLQQQLVDLQQQLAELQELNDMLIAMNAPEQPEETIEDIIEDIIEND